MSFKSSSIMLGVLITIVSFNSSAIPTLKTTDFIDDMSRTHFNGFEAIPNDGEHYTEGYGPYIEDGISVEQKGDAGSGGGPGILVNYDDGGTYEGLYSWYPDGGDHGYTEITMADSSEFFDVGFYVGTGNSELSDPISILFDLLLDGVSVLSGTTPAPLTGSLQYIGFSGGGFDTIRIRDNVVDLSLDFYDGTWNALSIDAIETAGYVSVPEPTVLALLCLGLVVIGLTARRDPEGLRMFGVRAKTSL